MKTLILIAAMLINTTAQAANPFYVLTLRSRKTSYSLNPFDHIKDSVNSLEFKIAVDKRIYDKVKVGENLGSSFAVGGTPGSINIEVTHKEVRPQFDVGEGGE